MRFFLSFLLQLNAARNGQPHYAVTTTRQEFNRQFPRWNPSTHSFDGAA